MFRKNIYRAAAVFLPAFLVIAGLSVIFKGNLQINGLNVLGVSGSVISPESSDSEKTVKSGETVLNYPIPTNIPHQIQPPEEEPVKPAPPESLVVFDDAPVEIMEGNTATFSWTVSAVNQQIHKTAVYFGILSSPGKLADSIAPENAGYPLFTKDFIDGTYNIPLRFIGSIPAESAGTYFYRAYADIGGKHVWSDERSFTVKPLPKHEIRIVSSPGQITSGGNAAFTWEITGPDAITTFTTIVAAKTSKPEKLDTSVNLQMTPYTVLVKDFTNGSFNVPLRFIGNAPITEPGEYYFRALAFINNRNIWSDEFNFSVKQ